MKNLLIKWLATSVAVFSVPYLITGVEVSDFRTALAVAFVLGLLNLLVRPILFLITLPITLLTLGLFTFVLNAFIFQLAAHFIEGFYIRGFWSAFFASLLVSFISWVIQAFFRSGSAGPRIHWRVENFRNRRPVRDLNS